MKLIKFTFAIAVQNFRKWLTDYRIWVIAAILLILVHENVKNLTDFSKTAGVASSIWIFPFLYSQYHQKLIFTMPLILIFCNAPFTDSNSIFVIKRSGKFLNALGQITYVVIAAFIYYLFIFLTSFIFSMPHGEFSNEWGKILNIIAYTTAASNAGYHFLDASGFVMTYFTPIMACWFTFLMSWLSGILIGLIIYVFNLISQTRYMGCIAGGIVIIYSSFAATFGTKKSLYFSPVSWNTLNNIDVGKLTNNPSFAYCMSVYLISILILTAVILFISKKRAIDTIK